MELKKDAKTTPFGEYLKKHIVGKDNKFKSVSELAKALGTSRQMLHHVIYGTQPLPPSLAGALSEKAGNSASFWLGLGRKDFLDPFIKYDDLTGTQLIERWRQLNVVSLVDRDIWAANRFSILTIDPFDEECLRPVSYDLRIGSEIFDTSSEKLIERELSEDNVFDLETGCSAIIRTYEKLTFPNFIFGNLGSMTHLSSNGILLCHGIQVDPCYNNFLWVTVYNFGTKNFPLRLKNPLLSMEIRFLPNEPEYGGQIESEYESVLSKVKNAVQSDNNNHRKEYRETIEQLKKIMKKLENLE